MGKEQFDEILIARCKSDLWTMVCDWPPVHFCECCTICHHTMCIVL